MRPVLKVISKESASYTQMQSWCCHIQETGMFLSSQLPDKLLPTHTEQLGVETVSFDKSVSPKIISTLPSLRLVVAEDLTLLDFGQQEWTLEHLKMLLQWLEPSLKRIMLCRLANASFTLDALRYLVQFLRQQKITIESLDLGSMHMSLPRVDIIAALATDKVVAIKKLDFGMSRWEMSHMKAMMWTFAHNGYHLERVALSSIECPAVGLDLLVQHMVQISDKLRVFSTGVTPLSDKAHALILRELQHSDATLQACIFSYQSFSTANTALLAKLIVNASSLKRLALMHCQWYADYLQLKQDASQAIEKLYLEYTDYDGYIALLSSLKSVGYSVDKQSADGSRVWLGR